MIRSYENRVLVRIVEKPQKQGILIMPDEKKTFEVGEVVSAGDYIHLRPGNFVYFRNYSGILIEYDGVPYLSLDEKEILAHSDDLK